MKQMIYVGYNETLFIYRRMLIFIIRVLIYTFEFRISLQNMHFCLLNLLGAGGFDKHCTPLSFVYLTPPAHSRTGMGFPANKRAFGLLLFGPLLQSTNVHTH